jgi:transcriptional regulator with XRE-family HTH domain
MELIFEDSLGRRVMSARMRRGVRQGELARAIGVSQNTLSLIEKGETQDPRSSIITNIARVLHVSTDYLLGLTDEIEPRGARADIAASG